jgi:N-methylhydantoinase A
MRIAIDSGGTFTDCVFVWENKLHIIKVASRPTAPAEAIAEAVQLALAHSPEQENDLDLVCGTTVGTNALLEKRGGRVALVTTAGFEDVLEIGRQARPRLYDLFAQKSVPPVPASLRLGVKERLAADGQIVQPLSSREIGRLTREIGMLKPYSVALCLLFSFRNPKHEKQIAASLRAAGYHVSVSHEILPEFREYERTSTVVINAYLVPLMSGYLRDISTRVAALAALPSGAAKSNATSPTRVRIMQSNGGIISAEQAAREPVRTILSGPAGGVIGADQAAKLAGLEKCISFDMGGTSTDVALLTKDLHTTGEAIVAGFPVAVPMLEIHTVGAGGGSIARFDTGGALRVGPESAGAEPGPICYGRGTKSTVTDAHAVLGHLGSAGLLGGTFSLDVSRARALMGERIQTSRAFGSVEAFAQGIIAVANAVMEKAIRVISIERGHDPRDYSLIAFGGAGGLHACDLAAALEMRSVLIPVFPGGLSALGILRADVVKELSRTVLLLAEAGQANPGQLKRLFGSLEAEAACILRSEGFDRKKMRFHFSVDMRYLGQAYELNVSADNNIVDAFHQMHQQRYGYYNKNAKAEIVNVRCRATGVTEKPTSERIDRRRGGRQAPSQVTRLVFNGRRQGAAAYQRDEFRAGDNFVGPAIVLEYSATTLIPPRWQARVDDYGQLLLTQRKSGRRN